MAVASSWVMLVKIRPCCQQLHCWMWIPLCGPSHGYNRWAPTRKIVLLQMQHNCLNTMLYFANTTCYFWFQTYPFSYEAKGNETVCTYNTVIGVAAAALVLLLVVVFVTYMVTKRSTKKKLQKSSQSPDVSPDPSEVRLWMHLWIWWSLSPSLNQCK